MSQRHIPKRMFGQNFLQVPYYIERIVSAVPAGEGDTVVEIGPGMGALSRELVKGSFRYIMIEKDRDVIPHLKEALGEGSYQIIEGDATTFDYSSISSPFHSVGNLPYNVASIIIKELLFQAERMASGTYMVQKEVADRICASPGGKTIGFLTILCTYFGRVEKLFDVPPGAFYPPPKVTSSVFRVNLSEDCWGRLERDHWEPFFALVSKAYQMRRKKLVNSLLSKTSSKEEALSALQRAGIDTSVRPEELAVEEWISLYKQLIS